MSTSAISISYPLALGDKRVAHSKQTNETRPPFELTGRAEPIVELDQMPGSTQDNGNSLGQIKGIGPAVLKILTEHGLNSCADMADCTPTGLAGLLKVRIPSMSAKRIERENWIGQAQMCARRQEEQTSLKSEADNTNGSPQQAKADDPANATRENWREVADFFVSFGFTIDPQGEEVLKTRVHHSQADIPEEWDGIATDKLVNWMLRQANLRLPPEPPAEEIGASASTASPTPYDAQVEILTFQLSEVPASPGVWEKKLRAQVRLRISGPDAETLARRQTPFQINVYAVDLEDKALAVVAYAGGQLELSKTEYTQHMTFPVPGLGRYELHSIAFTIPPVRLPAVHRGPTLNVLP